MKNARNPLIGMIAFGAVLAMPLAFAQEVPQTQDPTQQEYTNPAPTTQSAEPQALTWADLDSDGDGKLSREEVASVDALVQAFDAADTDNDGLLTPEEYSAYVASTNSAPPADGGSD